MRAAFVLKDRSDPELLAGVCAAIAREKEDVALVMAHLAEMDTRKLFAGEGCSSLKSYCTEVLHLSEDEAYLRIHVAKVARQFPVVLEMLADGLVHLTAVHRLGPSLTEENHLSVLEEASHQSMAKVEEIVARLRPKPPVPSRICKLSGKRAGALDPGSLPKEAPVDSAGKRPPSRYIPIAVRNAVWQRDQGRCAFMAERGRWCSERRFLEYHHIIPFALGGETTVDNLELRCRTHNGYEGELLFGRVLRKNSVKARSVLEAARFKTSAWNHRPEQMR